ncbi:MAG: hypothetical protein ABW087_09420, partial [Candidatus Thiodiazotropha sp.]
KYRSRSDFIAKNMSTFEWLDVFHDLFRRSLTESIVNAYGEDGNSRKLQWIPLSPAWLAR